MGFYSGGTRDTLSLSDKSYLHGKRVLVALSGGKDSVCLLRLLCLERDRGALELFAAHVEHGIRGEASKRDMEFCFELCQSLDVPFYSLGADVPRLAEASGEGLETCARRVRHEFLRKTARELNCDLIALAHHRRDRAETLLMHLLRGSSLKGMAAMPEIDRKDGGVTLVRPLIDVSPEEIKQYLEDMGQPWREDATNFLPDNPRNAIRLSVLPLLREIYPGGEDALCRFGDICAREDAYLDNLARQYLEDRSETVWGTRVFHLSGDKPKDDPLLYRAIKLALPFLDYADMERMLGQTGFADAGQGWRTFLAKDALYALPPAEDPGEIGVTVPGAYEMPGVCRLILSPCESAAIKNNGLTQRLDKSALDGACLRLRREGDYIRPFGMKGTKSLGDYMTDRKVPLPLRDFMPLLARGSEVVWLPGVGISESARVENGRPACEAAMESV